VKIAIISGSAGDGRCGVGDYAYELAQHLALDADVHLYFSQGHGPVDPPHPRLSTLQLHPINGFSLFVTGQITEEMRQGEFDVVHIQYPSKGYGTSLGPGFIPQNLSGMKSRSRLCVTLHEWSTSHPLRRLVMDQMLKAVDGALSTSALEMEAIAARLRREQRVVAIPVGNVLRSRAELDAVFDEAQDGGPPMVAAPQAGEGRVPFSLFHFGLPAKNKGLNRLLFALQLLREELKVPAQLFLAGDFPPGDPLTEELLAQITELGLSEGVVRLGYLEREELQRWAQKYMAGVFPFDEGYSSKRSSIAALSECDLPLVVGSGSVEEHPYYAPLSNSPEDLAKLLAELLQGQLQKAWNLQIERQREFARRFRFSNIAQQHLTFYKGLRKIDS
jgi:glycosyltransferase involved in cell wall biosynthesis